MPPRRRVKKFLAAIQRLQQQGTERLDPVDSVELMLSHRQLAHLLIILKHDSF
jgi:hypothetical protein